MSNFPCSLTRNITSHSMKNLAFHCLLRWKMIALQILTTSYPYIYRLEKCAFWTYMVRLAVQFTITYCILHSRTLRRSLYSWSRCITFFLRRPSCTSTTFNNENLGENVSYMYLNLSSKQHWHLLFSQYLKCDSLCNNQLTTNDRSL